MFDLLVNAVRRADNCGICCHDIRRDRTFSGGSIFRGKEI